MRDLRSSIRLAAITTLAFALLGVDCEDTSGPDPADTPQIAEIAGTYVVTMTFQSRTGSQPLSCPPDGHVFTDLVVSVNSVTGTVTLHFTFPVTGPYNPSTGAYVASGRTDTGDGFDLEIAIDGVFSRERDAGNTIALTGSSFVRVVSRAGGAEFCRTTLGIRMERTGA